MATKILPPDLAVRLAWGLTGAWSETKSVQDEASANRARLKDLAEMGDKSGDAAEKEFVSKAADYINASGRTLANIYSARKLNFDNVKEMRDSKVEDIQAYSKLTANWQSAWPRLLSVGVGGSAGAITLSQFLRTTFPKVNLALLEFLFAVVGAGILYLFNELVVLPWVRRSLMMERVRADYDRGLYYSQFAERTRSALIALYADVDRAHLKAFGSPYDTKANPGAIVDGALAGIPSTMCPKATPHMDRGIIKPNLWSMCESGQYKEACPYWGK